MRYYFNLREVADYVSDEEGLDLPHLDAAFEAARRGARSVLADEVLQGRLSLATIMEVRDEQGRLKFELPFKQVVSIDY
jgi:hypothetical protein